MFFGDGAKGNKFGNTRVGENNIESPLYLSHGLVKTIKVGQFGNVSLNSRNVSANGLHGLVEFLLSAAGDEDVGTLFDEKLCGSQPNPFGAAGYDGDLAIELFRHLYVSVIAELSRTFLNRCFQIASPNARSFEPKHCLAEVIGQMVGAAQQNGEAI